MKAQLTEDDIEFGIPEDPCFCPIAKALRRECGTQHITVHCEMAWVDSKLYKLSPNAIKFISDFDSMQEVEPMEFEITEY